MVGVLPIMVIFLHLCCNCFFFAIFSTQKRNNVNWYHFIPCMFLNLFPISTYFNIELSSDGLHSPNNSFLPPPMSEPFLSAIFPKHNRNYVNWYCYIPYMFLNPFLIFSQSSGWVKWWCLALSQYSSSFSICVATVFCPLFSENTKETI